MSNNQKEIRMSGKEIAKNQNADLQKSNLSEIAKIAEGKNVSHAKREKQSIYKYPEGFTKDKINSDEGKKWRNNKRNRMQSFANNFFHYSQIQDEKGLQETLIAFDKFYKEFYILNDYSLSSITNARDKGKEKNIDDMLRIIRIMKGIKK